MLYATTLLFSLLFSGAVALPTDRNSEGHGHLHDAQRALPTNWYQNRDHPVHDLFKRGTDDGVTYAQVGSPTWSAAYPAWTPDTSALPSAWVAALNAAVAAGKIPDVPVSTNTPGTNPVYPNGLDPNSADVCSATYKCRIPGDIWDSPDGVFASAFDDGPTSSTPSLVQFLGNNSEKTTHFMIGVNIISYPSQFLMAFEADHDIAVHTWTHPYMTTLSNLDVLGQLGWTMQLIHNSTGGRVPKYWRPPYGDSDTRVRAIALEVFGLTTVVWNNDTNDWESKPPAIQTAMTKFLSSPKSPGLIILEHELTDDTVTGFMDSYPMIKSNGWNFMSLAKAVGDGSTYQNADGSSTDDVEPAGILLDASSSASSSSTGSSSGASTPSPTSASSSQTQITTSTGTVGDNLTPSAITTKTSAAPLKASIPWLFPLIIGVSTTMLLLL